MQPVAALVVRFLDVLSVRVNVLLKLTLQVVRIVVDIAFPIRDRSRLASVVVSRLGDCV